MTNKNHCFLIGNHYSFLVLEKESQNTRKSLILNLIAYLLFISPLLKSETLLKLWLSKNHCFLIGNHNSFLVLDQE